MREICPLCGEATQEPYLAPMTEDRTMDARRVSLDTNQRVRRYPLGTVICLKHAFRFTPRRLISVINRYGAPFRRVS